MALPPFALGERPVRDLADECLHERVLSTRRRARIRLDGEDLASDEGMQPRAGEELAADEEMEPRSESLGRFAGDRRETVECECLTEDGRVLEDGSISR